MYKNKKIRNSGQSQIKKNIKRRVSTSSDEEDEMVLLRRKIKETEEQLVALKETQALPAVEESSQTCDDDDDEQLLGSKFHEKMICIGNNIYCRAIIHNMALGTSHKSSHVARKLLEGVFKIDILKKATLTGQPPRAQGLERQLEPVVALNYKAREAIIDFSFRVAKERNWEQQSKKDVERAMSQRLGEIKRRQ
ncbi:uncharacterized protein LOC142237066 [Haematobia irritans]|uniref:uncharacterized protein LOC142233354 n=1 Tax=Haematobia irritans TaxID=7368 RepID=UPI003F501001